MKIKSTRASKTRHTPADVTKKSPSTPAHATEKVKVRWGWGSDEISPR